MLSHPVSPAPFGVPSILNQGFEVSRASLFPVSLQHRVQGHLLSKEASPQGARSSGDSVLGTAEISPLKHPTSLRAENQARGRGLDLFTRLGGVLGCIPGCWLAGAEPLFPLLLLEFGAWSLLCASKSFHLLQLLILLCKVVVHFTGLLWE